MSNRKNQTKNSGLHIALAAALIFLAVLMLFAGAGAADEDIVTPIKAPMENYQMIKEIEVSGGVSYIDTGVSATLDTEVRVIFGFPTVTDAVKTIISSGHGDHTGAENSYGIVISHWAAGPSLALRFGDNGGKGYIPDPGKIPLKANTTYDVTLNKDCAIVNIQKEDYSIETYEYSIDAKSMGAKYNEHEHLYLFTEIWATHSSTGVKIRSATIKEKNIFVRNFVPCYNKSNRDEIGMYETVEGNFYGMSKHGSGGKVQGGETESKPYYVIYNNNGATSGYPLYPTYPSDSEGKVTISGKGTLERTDYTFMGWRDSETGKLYQEGDEIVLTKDISLYPDWSKIEIDCYDKLCEAIAAVPSDGKEISIRLKANESSDAWNFPTHLEIKSDQKIRIMPESDSIVLNNTNTSLQDGGLFFVNGGTLTLCGNGTADLTLTSKNGGNAANGGAMYVNSGELILKDGVKITGNTVTENGGGVYVSGNGVLKVGGNVVVSGNTKEDNANNVYLVAESSGDAQNRLIQTAPLTDDSRIGIANPDSYGKKFGTQSFSSEDSGYGYFVNDHHSSISHVVDGTFLKWEDAPDDTPTHYTLTIPPEFVFTTPYTQPVGTITLNNIFVRSDEQIVVTMSSEHYKDGFYHLQHTTNPALNITYDIQMKDGSGVFSPIPRDGEGKAKIITVTSLPDTTLNYEMKLVNAGSVPPFAGSFTDRLTFVGTVEPLTSPTPEPDS